MRYHHIVIQQEIYTSSHEESASHIETIRRSETNEESLKLCMEHKIQIQCGGSTRTYKISANNYKHTNTDDDDDDDDDIIHLH